MKKRMVILLMLVLIVGLTILTGCMSEQEQEQKSTKLRVNTTTDAPAIDSDSLINVTMESSKNSIIGKSLDFATDFSEDRAWIQYREVYQGNWMSRAAVIDTRGQILWESDLASGGIAANTSSYKDGVSYFGYDPDAHGKCKSYNIIDSEGNITFSEKQDGFMILGYGNDQFLVAQHIENFDTNEWHFGAIDRYGNIVVPLQAYDDISNIETNSGTISLVECKYLGENIFYLNFSYIHGVNPVILNIETRKVILNYEDLMYVHLLTDFENGYAITDIKDNGFSSFWRDKIQPGIYIRNRWYPH